MTEPSIGRIASDPPQLLRLLSCIRLDEVAVLQGAPFIGAILAMGSLTLAHLGMLGILVAGNICLVAHVFVFNDWSGIDGDLRNPHRVADTFVARGLGRAEIGYFALALLAAGLALLALLGTATFILAVVIAGLSALYSAPALHLKAAPLWNSALHFLGGGTHFLLGFATFQQIDARGLGLACFFGLAFTAGHLTHEVRDFDSDFGNGIRTNAVAFGRERNFVAGTILFTAAYALLAVLATRGLLPGFLIAAALLIPIHLAASLAALRSGLSRDSLLKQQVLYRVLYAVLGVSMVLAACLGWLSPAALG